jgi:hypothetical protein
MIRALLAAALPLLTALSLSPQVPLVPTRAAPPALELIEHRMPLAQPHLYEQAVRAACADRGEVLRWYIASVEEATSTAVAEIVVLRAQRDND